MRAAEDHGVDACGLQRRRVLAHGALPSPRRTGRRPRSAARGAGRRPGGRRCRRRARGRARRSGPPSTVAAVASRPTRRLRVACTAACASGVITPTTGTASSSCSRGSAAEVAALHATTMSFTSCCSRIGADLAREAADLLERPRPVRQARVVAEVDEVLVRHRHEALVEDGQAADARVEDAYGVAGPWRPS